MDSLYRRVTVDTGWLAFSRLTSQGLAFLAIVLIAQFLGEEGLGQYAFITAVVFVGNVFSTFGTDIFIVREVAAHQRADQALLAAALTIQLILSGIYCAGVILLADHLMPGRDASTVVALRIAVLMIIPQAFSTVYSATLRAFQRMDLYTAYLAITTLMQIAGISLVLWGGGGLPEITGVLVGAAVIGAGFSGVLCRTSIPGFGVLSAEDGSRLIPVLKASLPLALLVTVSVLYQRLSIFMLASLVGDAGVGWFSAASRLVEALKTLPAAYAGALLPILSDRANGENLRGLGGLGIMIGYGLGGALLLALLADPLVPLVYGSGFGPSIYLLRVLAWSLPAYVIVVKASTELITGGNEIVALVASGGILSVSALLHRLLIPLAGINGAAWVTLISETGFALLLLGLAVMFNRRKGHLDEFPAVVR